MCVCVNMYVKFCHTIINKEKRLKYHILWGKRNLVTNVHYNKNLKIENVI